MMTAAGALALRFLAGGLFVSLFAVVGSLFRPKSFAGLFATDGRGFALGEARTMTVGALAFSAYASVVAAYLFRRRGRPLRVSLLALVAWFAVAGGGWALSQAAA